MPTNVWITVYSETKRGEVTHHAYVTSWSRAWEHVLKMRQVYPDRLVDAQPWRGVGPQIVNEVV